MKSNKIWIAIIVILLIIIIVMTWYLVVTPSKNAALTAPATSTVPSTKAAISTASSSEPLSARVKVFSPASGASVERTFTISGVAPNAWYSEAVFPIQIRDGDDNLIASGQGHAQSDWTVDGPVPFIATITVTRVYSGPANLILLRDNPSGLPENSDEVTIPIIVI
jgi:hypothetical protein